MATAASQQYAELIEPGVIGVRHPGTPEQVGFVKELPFSNWDKKRRRWTVAATPLTACLLMARDYELSPELVALASQWFEATLSSEFETTQPPKTVFESWSHQCYGHWFAVARAAALLGMDMGTGKTKTAIDAVVTWEVRSLLVICPKAVLPTWEDQFAMHCAVPHKVLLLDQATAAKKLLAGMNGQLAWNDRLLATVINYESAWRGDIAKWLLSRRWDCVLLDESHKIKSPQGAASKFCGQLGLRAERRLCLTGTPMGHSPLDLFGQCRFLEPALYGTSYTRFRSRYAVVNPMFPSKVERWINQDELQAKLATIAYRVKSDDVLDLPEQIHHQTPIILSDAARKIYDELERELVVELGTGDTVVVENALSKLLRLQQITSGFLPVEEPAETLGGDPIQKLIPIDTAKAEALAELFESLPDDEPIAVACKFRRDLEVVKQTAEKCGRRPFELSGTRNTLAEWKQSTGGDVIAVQIQSGGAGVDLTRSRYCVIYSLGYSLTDYEQFIKRQHRPGQTRSVHYYHFVARATVDVAVYRALRDRKEVIEAVLSILKRDKTA